MLPSSAPKAFKAGEASEGKYTLLDSGKSNAFPQVTEWTNAVDDMMGYVYGGGKVQHCGAVFGGARIWDGHVPVLPARPKAAERLVSGDGKCCA